MEPPLHLSAATLHRLPARVRVPRYDRTAVQPSIMHVGVGGFHRAHQAVYLDDLLQLTGSAEWGYCGVGLLEQDAGMRDVLRAQDCLYAVLERSAAADEVRVVGSIVEYLHAQEDRELVLSRLASPRCRIVSLTVTEGGYYRTEATGEFNETHPDIEHDLAKPHAPRCSFGYLVEALDRRRLAGLGPFTVMSCDNLQHNGDTARSMLLAFAERRDPALHHWIAEHTAFPNSMVDRIVPATSAEHRSVVADAFGIVDAWPVGTEPFRQWVIEDRFSCGCPAWERVGAQVTSDVEPYEKMKMRLLNGGHQALCHVGMLLGYSYAHEALGDSAIRRLVQGMMDDEISPLLAAPPGIDLASYKRTLLERLGNPTIRDQLARIGTDSSARMPKFVLPSIAEQLQRGGPIDALCFTVAAWFHFLGGRDDRGQPLEVVDPMRGRLVAAAGDAGPGFAGLFGLHDLIGEALLQSPRFRNHVKDVLQSFREQGVRQTLDRFVETRAVR